MKEKQRWPWESSLPNDVVWNTPIKTYILPDNAILMPSYHPSPRNVNTKLVSQKMMIALFRKEKKLSTA